MQFCLLGKSNEKNTHNDVPAPDSVTLFSVAKAADLLGVMA